MNTFLRLKGVALTLLCGAALSAPAQVTKQGSAYRLRVSYRKGQVLNFVLSTSAQMPGQARSNPTMSGPLQVKVLKVSKGISTLHTTIGPVKLPGGGQMPVQSSDMQVDTLGRAVGGQGASPTGTFPENPVRVGQTWSAQMPMGAAGGSMNAKFIFRGVKTVGGKRVALIEMAIDSVIRGMEVTGRGDIQVLAQDGTLVRMNMALNMKMPAANGKSGGFVKSVTTMIRK